ncbi:MAG: DUF6567 family protein [Bacteroidales bacterium]|jgi:hypothetical protein
MKKLNIIAIIIVVLMATSCSITKKGVPSAPISVQINLSMENLEYLGDATGTSTQSYFIGIPLGGRKYKVGTAIPQGSLAISIPQSRGMNNAMYDALISKPNADFVLPISYEINKQQMFLGSKTTLTIKTKAFRIKTK